MIEIQLNGSFEAVCGEYRYSHPRKSPVGPLLRKMIKDGVASLDNEVIIKRGQTVCFNASPVSVWSEWTITDRDSGGIHRTKYVPFTGIGKDNAD